MDWATLCEALGRAGVDLMDHFFRALIIIFVEPPHSVFTHIFDRTFGHLLRLVPKWAWLSLPVVFCLLGLWHYGAGSHDAWTLTVGLTILFFVMML